MAEPQIEECPSCGYDGYFTYVTDIYLACPRCGCLLDENGGLVSVGEDKDTSVKATLKREDM